MSDDLDEIWEEVYEALEEEYMSAGSRRNLLKAISTRKSSVDTEYEEDDDLGQKFVQWGSSDGTIFTPTSKTTQTLTPGVYEVDQHPQMGLYFKKIPVKTEGLLRFPDTNSDKVVNEIQSFWERKELFEEYGLTYKRGILLYGPPGSGKTCTVQLIMEDVVKRDGIVIKFIDPYVFLDGMRVLRQIQPDCPVVTIMEDIDSTLELYNESEILNILDGVNQVERVVFLATTNYPKKLGTRIMNRPSRFDKRFRIGYPSSESRRMYFEHLIGKEKIEELKIDLKKWVKDTGKMSIAHLKELFVAVVILDDDYKDAIKTLRKMKDVVDDSEATNGMGFQGSMDEEWYDEDE